MMRHFGQEIHATLNDELCPGEGDAWQDAQCGEGDAEGSEDEEGHETWDLDLPVPADTLPADWR